ncbi:MAG: PDZ domain-containing protein [Proteobacteria bacterium]|nr:PDZ domain-containing protein [Pseudomonadota bacterium]
MSVARLMSPLRCRMFAALLWLLAAAPVAQAIAAAPGASGLGVPPPPALPAARIAALLVPATDTAPRRLVGAKPWPGHPGRFVAIVCTGGAAPYSDTPNAPRCAQPESKTEPKLHVYLGVIAAGPGVAPRLIAGGGPIRAAVDWGLSDLPAPDAAQGAPGPVPPARIDRFDLAAYRIAPGQTAFGLRVSWRDMYSGGGGYFSALCLYAIEGGRLRRVLAVPMHAQQLIAGDWHKNGTRDHQDIDAANLLVVARTRTAGHFDLIVRPTNADYAARPWSGRIGIGAAVAERDGTVTIQSTIVGDPAAQAGLRAGDRIARIDGHTVRGMDAKAVAAAMNGVLGGRVVLTIRRPGQAPFDVTLVRTTFTLAPSSHLRFRWSRAAGAYRAAVCTGNCL